MARFIVVLGAGVTLAVAWELAEFPTFLHGSDELTTAYEDTLSDLALAFVGSTLAALIAARRPSADVAQDPGASETALALGSR